MIRKREKDAMEEYRNYILDTIDTTGMKDWEKAEFLNTNHSILDLSSDRIKELVGNPHYWYDKREIKIPITGWGDYKELVYTDDYQTKTDANGDAVRDADGRIVQEVVGTTLKPHMCRTKRALKWSEYSLHNGKTSKMGNTIYVKPTQKLLIFVRDNSFSFLKKISWYCDENEINRYDGTDVMVLDMYSDANMTSNSLKMLKGLIGHTAKFVHLSGITLPKSISLTPSSGYTTPVARLFNKGKHNFRNPKWWDDVYTPLTKIDTDAYVVKTHRGQFDEMSWSDQCFMETYLKSAYDFDESINILVLSRARYEKAIKYGFKPIYELVKELKKNIEIPVEVVHADLFEDLHSQIESTNIIRMLGYFDANDFSKIDDTTNVHKLVRIRKIIEKRYTSKESEYRSMREMVEYMDEGTELPKPLKSVQKFVDSVSELCDTMDSGYTLVDSRNHWFFQEDGRKAELIEYINWYEAKESAKSKSQEQDDNE